MMTMALSTSMPIATIKAPRDMRCRVLPIMSRMGKVTAMVSTSPKPMMRPLRKPMVNISTMMTISTDSSRLSMKPLMASLTLSGWKKIFSVVIPAGSRSAITLANC